MGIVPYIQNREAIPKSDAGITPSTPSFLPCIAANNRCVLSLANTETQEPTTIPTTQ
ncbi:hypothetical protein FACS1894172_10770 [Spirochaetia bacterium]|nr:hypothetical protein FACS1894164_18900 [Spirochaetia bacterium]GHU33037.1 hypothetical protein FACS1894172_10770 [Spirochaetia bacterium]